MIKTIICKITSLKDPNNKDFPSSDEFTKIKWGEVLDDKYKRFAGKLISVSSNINYYIIFNKESAKNSIFYQNVYFDQDTSNFDEKYFNFDKTIIAFNDKVVSNEYFELDNFEIFTPKRNLLDFKIDDFIIVMQVELVYK